MADIAAKLPVKTVDKPTAAARDAIGLPWVNDLRREIDRLFEDFNRGWPRSFRAMPLESMLTSEFSLGTPAVDVVEKDTAFELTAELPGMSAKDIDVAVKDGNVVITGEKKSEKEHKSKDYHVRERQYGSFERSFTLPQGTDPSAIEAVFNNGVLTVSMPKTADAQKPAKKIEVKAA